ncbi:MAG: SDR family oxidoreductase [Deltaproteobacteria bacterium]|nr:SDR family oxidoreductase [Deltaproteobacteria bacterium]
MKSVIITGSSRGIGLGMAQEFLKRGCAVTLSARSRQKLGEEAQRLAQEFGGDRVFSQPCDVNDPAQLQALWDAAHAKFGRVDIWINNAGISTSTIPLWELDSRQIESVVHTNLTGTIYGCQVAIKGMLEQGSGQIYNFEGHGSNDMVLAGLSVYGSTKRAVRYFTESLIEETKETPVQVGAIGPGMVITDLLLNDLRNMPPEKFEMAKITFNVLGDKVETVTPWLVEGVLNNTETGARIDWLTEEKANARFADEAYIERDLLGEFGF